MTRRASLTLRCSWKPDNSRAAHRSVASTSAVVTAARPIAAQRNAVSHAVHPGVARKTLTEPAVLKKRRVVVADNTNAMFAPCTAN